MNTNLRQSARAVFFAFTFLFVVSEAFGLGSDYPAGKPVGGANTWPEGMKGMVNTPNRVHGYFVNAEDLFFYSGTAAEFTAFLREYSKNQPIEKHTLILHSGVGEAKSPWAKSGQPCDWKLYGCPKSWLTRDAKDTAYVLEVHLWTDGRIALDQVTVPQNVEVKKDKQPFYAPPDGSGPR